MSPRALVGAFYFEVRNWADEERAREILAESFRFRGSLGAGRTASSPTCATRTGRSATTAASSTNWQRTEIGRRRGCASRESTAPKFLGAAASGRQIIWAGAPFFRCEAGRIAELWVLGDLTELRRQLRT